MRERRNDIYREISREGERETDRQTEPAAPGAYRVGNRAKNGKYGPITFKQKQASAPHMPPKLF